jgi:transcription termination factor 2
VGQKREVTIHRFLCVDTVETRIVDLQKKKLDLADGVLTGAKRASKLTFDDLKSLFGLK